LGKDIEQPSEGLEEIEEQTIEELLSHKENLEQQGDMMVGTSSGTTRSYVFKIDSLSVDAEQMQENINADGQTRIVLGEGK